MIASATDLIRRRLHNQKLTRSTFRTPTEVVAWLGAVQAQDFAGAKWALGLRAIALTDHAVEDAFDDGRILRTHVMRPTWHFVAPRDIRWILALTAPRVHACNAHYYRKMGLTERDFRRSRTALERALQNHRYLTRAELALVFRRAGIAADGQKLAYLMMHAELEQVICSGPRRGKQFTYALLDERAPDARRLDRADALVELTRRYFTSHGPATLRDYVWWSGLTVRDARTGLDAVRPALERATVENRAYWFAATKERVARASTTAWLLPNYDEYLIAHKDRDLFVESSGAPKQVDARASEYPHLIVIDGRPAGTWKRTVKAGAILLDANLYRPLTRMQARALAKAAERYGTFMNAPVTLSNRYRLAAITSPSDSGRML